MNKAIDIFLQPGEYFVGDADYRIRTLLGSCVSMTLWHPQRKIGAMSHFLLAQRGNANSPWPDARYGEEAMELMVEELARAQVAPGECQGKIFGGGNMFPWLNSSSQPVGQKNGEAARRLMRDYGIPVMSESLFGIGHRQIIFDVQSGHVWANQVRLAGPGSLTMEQTA